MAPEVRMESKREYCEAAELNAMPPLKIQLSGNVTPVTNIKDSFDGTAFQNQSRDP